MVIERFWIGKREEDGATPPLGRAAASAFNVASFNALRYPQSDQNREETGSLRKKNALFIRRVYSFPCYEPATVSVNSAA